MTLDKDKLHLAMARNCITIQELAEKSSVTRPAIVNCINGKRNPKPVTIGKLARALNIDPTELLQD